MTSGMSTHRQGIRGSRRDAAAPRGEPPRHPPSNGEVKPDDQHAEAEPMTDTSLFGLLVQLPHPCRCGTTEAEIEPGRGSHHTGLRCTFCGRHAGWMSRTSHYFLTTVIGKFGCPTAPIRIRATARTTAPSGADAASQSMHPATAPAEPALAIGDENDR